MQRADNSNSNRSLKDDFIESLDSTLRKLTSIWDEVGIFDDVRNVRQGAVILHLKNLLEVMVAEEESMKAEFYSNIDKFKKEVNKLCKDFQLPDFQPVSGLTVIQLEKEYRVKAESLNKEKGERLNQLKELSSVDQRLCDELCETPFYIPSGSLPSPQQLNQLQEHIAKLQAEKEKRSKEFRELKQSIQRYVTELELSPNTSFERDVLAEDEDFLLTKKNMESLHNYHERLISRQKENVIEADRLRKELDKLWLRLDEPTENCYKFLAKYSDSAPKTLQALREELVRCKLAKIHNIRHFIDLARNDIRTWWDKCFYTVEQRAEFKPISSEVLSEDILEQHEDEARRLEDYYLENKEFFEKVERREKLWKDFLELERIASDPNRLFLNRGCNLLKEEKRRKMLMKELPKIEHEVEEEVVRWEKLTGNRFTIGGKSYSEYIKQQIENHRVQKEEEKFQRQQERAKKVEEEMKFGSKPLPVAAKRKIYGTPSTPSKSTSVKQRKVSPVKPCRFDLAAAAILTPSKKMNQMSAPVSTAPVSAPGPSVAVVTGDKNALFSETTVSSGEIQQCDPEATLAAAGKYEDFAATMNENIRTNCRSSSVMHWRDEN